MWYLIPLYFVGILSAVETALTTPKICTESATITCYSWKMKRTTCSVDAISTITNITVAKWLGQPCIYHDGRFTDIKGDLAMERVYGWDNVNGLWVYNNCNATFYVCRAEYCTDPQICTASTSTQAILSTMATVTTSYSSPTFNTTSNPHTSSTATLSTVTDTSTLACLSQAPQVQEGTFLYSETTSPGIIAGGVAGGLVGGLILGAVANNLYSRFKRKKIEPVDGAGNQDGTTTEHDVSVNVGKKPSRQTMTISEL